MAEGHAVSTATGTKRWRESTTEAIEMTNFQAYIGWFTLFFLYFWEVFF
jgi:hypothetical protein